MRKNLVKRSRPTVTIGIPAFNEEATIQPLLRSLLSQKSKLWRLKQIIVISDGSSDQTVIKAKAVKHPKLKVVNRKQRLGISRTQNQILKLADADYLVLLDADVMPADELVVERLIKPFSRNIKIGMVGGATVPMTATSLFEKIMVDSHQFKVSLFEKIDPNSNLFLCQGRIRALKKDFYTQLSWPENCPEDAYSYLACLSRGFKFVYQPQAIVIFRVPANLRDYRYQSLRFLDSTRVLKSFFGSEIVDTAYAIPSSLILRHLLGSFIQRPVTTLLYLVFNLINRFTFLPVQSVEHSLATAATSTKKTLRHET